MKTCHRSWAIQLLQNEGTFSVHQFNGSLKDGQCWLMCKLIVFIVVWHGAWERRGDWKPSINSAASTLELSEEKKPAFSVLEDKMYLVRFLNDMYLDNLVGEHESNFRNPIYETLDVELVDPAYNIRCNHAIENLDLDSLTAGYVKGMVSVCRKNLKPGSSTHAFRRSLHCRLLFRALGKEAEGLEDGSGTTTKKGSNYSRQVAVFEVRSILILSIRVSLCMIRSQRLGMLIKPWYTSRETESHLLARTVFSKTSWLSRARRCTDDAPMVNYSGEPILPGYSPWATFCSNSWSIHVQSHAVRPDQKSVSWRQYIITKFTKGDHFMLDPCAGMFTTGKGCMKLSKQWP